MHNSALKSTPKNYGVQNMTYSFEEAKETTLEYFKNDEIAADVFLKKYALKDENGGFLENTPDMMHRRLSGEFARIEKKYENPMSEEEIYGLFKDFKWIVPQGSPMSGIGNKSKIQSVSNCFVIDSPADSYGGILKADQEQAQIMKRRGGVGFDISTIRPSGVRTANAAETTDGIAVFMERFSNTCREVAQGGRRGALMLTISCHHPDIETFIKIKRDLKKVTGANISIRLTDEFMKAVRSDKEVELRFPVEKDAEHIVKEKRSAKEIWDMIIESAHGSAEPGLLFWDNVINNSPADCYADDGFKTISTNPCSEITLSAYDSCRLLVVNLFSFVKDPFTPEASFDFEKFGEVTIKAQRLMDDLIDLELECVDGIINKIKADPEADDVKKSELTLWQNIKEACIRGRRTGLGITALGDALAALGVNYGSKKSISITEDIYKTLAVKAYESSVIMAKERGAFEAYSYEKEKDHKFINRIINESSFLKENYVKYGRRNIALTTTAPTGSVSIMTQTTSGIEPAFSLSYKRRRKINPEDKGSRVDFTDDTGDRWQEYKVYHHKFKMWMDITGKESELESPYNGSLANDIDWLSSVRLQAGAQKWVCHAISKTCNLPKDATVELVGDIYMEAWKSGCKGFTVYREGSRSGVLVSGDAEQSNVFKEHPAPRRPETLTCDIHQANIKGEAWTILIGLMDGKPYEIFGGKSSTIEIPKKYKKGTLIKHPRKSMNSVYDLTFGEDDDKLTVKNVIKVFDNPTEGAFTRTISLALRHGAPIQFLTEQLQKDDRDSDMFSFSRVIARVLKGYIQDGTKASGECPDCGSKDVMYQEGCLTCPSCGYGKCG